MIYRIIYQKIVIGCNLVEKVFHLLFLRMLSLIDYMTGINYTFN